MGANDAKAAAEHKFQIYDADKGTFLGRTGASWLKITVFYIAYFAFLAGLFTASVQLMQSQLPDDKPKLNTRLNIPGLNYFPKFAASDADQKARLASNDGIAFYWKEGQKDGDAGYQYYVDQSQTILNNVTNTQSDVKDFDVNTLGECSNPQASWDAGKPCIYFRLNRVIDWQPVGLFKPEDGTIFAKDGPKKAMVKGATYVRCEAKDSESGEFVDAPFKYFGGDANGGDGYFPADFFPYKGKKAQPKYESPIVAVQVTNLEAGKQYKVACDAFAKNIVVDRKAGLGSVKFEFQKGGDLAGDQ